jgi:hypothetical protein
MIPLLSNSWFKGTGNPNGIQTILKVRKELKDAFDADMYKNRIELHWSYAGDNNGLPNQELLEKLNKAEELLQIIEKDNHSIHAVSIIGNNCASWIWYSKSEQLFMESLHQVLFDSEKLPIEILFEYDSEWEYYMEILSQCGISW